MSESDIESKAVRAGNVYFQGNVDRDRRGSAMELIARKAAQTKAKSEMLRALREARDAGTSSISPGEE